jgi:hypothetical protein
MSELPTTIQDSRVEHILGLDTEERPGFLEPEPEDHAWVTALEADLLSRIVVTELNGGVELCKDVTIEEIDSDSAYILGYRTAIHHLRSLANNEHLVVKLVEIDSEADGD